MLSTAPPLRQDFSNSIKLSQVSKPEIQSTSTQEPYRSSESEAGGVSDSASDINITSSGLLLLKTTAEALEEFRSYREMKELLLRKGSGSLITPADVGHVSETADKGGIGF
ncbi:hypothetical protein BVC80_1263g27 [Macleaya cordata]|uniref:Uncharacterized protein n=1 Tax=Macleaya cordata TaxID=56857 RepID=A0A200PV49_MACCD|nr:hypothetical protein BVC80_1263g27 [Macleaya cordata]